MTASEWSASADPRPMLESVRGLASDRQLRLFACACCRGAWEFVPPGPCREAVQSALRYADGLATLDELVAARRAAIPAAVAAGRHAPAAWAACATTEPSAYRAAIVAADEAMEQFRSSPGAVREAAATQARFLRDIWGDAVGLGQRLIRRGGWADDRLVQEIAHELYAGDTNDGAGALADALTRAGCPIPAVTAHYRASGSHVRGCWVVDLILGHEAGPPSESVMPQHVPPCLANVRAELIDYLGAQKFARFLRRALGTAPDQRPQSPPKEWLEFVAKHPEHGMLADEFDRLVRECCVHGCEVIEITVVDANEPPGIARDLEYLRARGQRFPYSHPPNAQIGGLGRVSWWCPQCQQERTGWDARYVSEHADILVSDHDEPAGDRK